MEIFAVKLSDQIFQEDVHRLISRIPEHAFRRVRHNSPRKFDHYHSLIGDILIRSVIHHQTNAKWSEIKIAVSKYGKPYIKNQADIHFNLSHSHEWVVAAVDRKPIGIDVEYIQPIDEEIARFYFSPIEYSNLIHVKEGAERLAYFYDLWTLKESFIKKVGKGLSIPLDTFSIIKDADNIEVIQVILKQAPYFKQYPIDSNYILSVCAEHDDFPRTPTVLSFVDLIRECLKMTTHIPI